MSFIGDKINRLKKQKKEVQHNEDIEKYNRESEKNYIDQQINAQKGEDIRAKKQEKQIKKKMIVGESRQLVFDAYKLLKRIGVINLKTEMGLLFNRHKSYFLMLECSNQAPPLDALVELKHNLNDIRCYLKDMIDTDDPVFHDWAKRKLNSIIDGLDRLEYKILKELYGIST